MESGKTNFENKLQQTELSTMSWKDNYTMNLARFFFNFQEIESSLKNNARRSQIPTKIPANFDALPINTKYQELR